MLLSLWVLVVASSNNFLRLGLPKYYFSRPPLDRDLWMGSYLATYLERDVRNILNVGSLRDFDRFLRAAALRKEGRCSNSSI